MGPSKARFEIIALVCVGNRPGVNHCQVRVSTKGWFPPATCVCLGCTAPSLFNLVSVMGMRSLLRQKLDLVSFVNYSWYQGSPPNYDFSNVTIGSLRAVTGGKCSFAHGEEQLRVVPPEFRQHRQEDSTKAQAAEERRKLIGDEMDAGRRWMAGHGPPVAAGAANPPVAAGAANPLVEMSAAARWIDGEADPPVAFGAANPLVAAGAATQHPPPDTAGEPPANDDELGC